MFNVTGDSTVTNVVHVCGGLDGCGSNNVGDLTLLQIARNSEGTNTIVDSLTPSGSSWSTVTDNQVAIYALGESKSSNGYGGNGAPRFTTAAQSTPTWLVGNGTPSSSCSVNGTMYSNNGIGLHTLYVCVAGSWVALI